MHPTGYKISTLTIPFAHSTLTTFWSQLIYSILARVLTLLTALNIYSCIQKLTLSAWNVSLILQQTPILQLAMLNKHGPSYLKWMLTDSCKKFIPKFKIPHKPTPRNCTQTLRRLYKRKPMPNNYTKLLHMESRLQASIQSSRNEYLQRLASLFQANPKILYEHLKQLSNSKFKPRFIVNNDTAIHDPKQMAEIFNHYFHSTFTTSDFSLPHISQLPTPLVYS